MASNIYTLYAVNFDPTTAGNAMLIDQVSNFSISPQIQEVLVAGDGAVDPTFVATMGQSPRLTFTTSALATVLAKASNAMLIDGLKIDSDVDDNGLEAFFYKLAEGGTRAGASSHLKMTINEGLLLPRSISAQQGDIAQMVLEAICTYDGTNDPVAIATGQSLTGSPSVGELFTIGKVSINGTDLDSVQSINIDTGISETIVAADGAVWPTFVGIMGRTPMITLTTHDVGVLNTFGLSGTAQGATDSIVYFRKIAEGGTRVADATEEHISISIAEGQIRVKDIPASHGQPAMAQIEIRPTYDGTNGIFVIDPTAAIV